MKKFLLTFAISFGLLANANAQSVDDLSFYTEEYPPYNFKQNGKNAGIAIDLLEAVFKKLGSAKTGQDVKLGDWSEAYNQALANPNAVVFSTTRSDERDPLFKWAGPITPTRTAIIAKKGAKAKVSDPTTLKGAKLAVIKNDIGQQLGKSVIGASDADFVEFSNLNDLVAGLEAGKADYWLYEENVALWTLKNKNLTDKYEILGALGTNDLSYAFNIDADDSIIMMIQDAIDELKASGEYQAIVEKYSK